MNARGPLNVVVIGGGFGGLACAKALGSRRADAPISVTMVDRRNHHLFQPLLYQVATASLSPAEIAAPLRTVLSRNRNTTVLLGEAVGVDIAGRRVILRDGEIPYDVLVVATGVTHSYFGRPEWASLARGLKTIEDAVEIRRRFLLAFEGAERESDPKARRARLTFIVVGGGPTGVELAGAMAEMAHRSIPRDFRSIDTTTARIILVEAMDRVLSAYPPELSARAKRDLEQLGVEVRVGSRVTHIDEDGVMVGTERIDSECVLWAAGVEASSVGRSLPGERDRSGRVVVTEDLTIPGHPEVFVIGDLARVVSEGNEVPGVAPAAVQMGKYAAKMIRRQSAGETGPRPAFRYLDKGMLATIGRARAVAKVWGVKFAGLLAWLLWAGVHVFMLIGFRSRLLVMIQWAWEYLMFARGARLITGDSQLGLHLPVAEGVALRPVLREDLPTFFAQQLDPGADHMTAFGAAEHADRAAFIARWESLLADPEVEKRTISSAGPEGTRTAGFLVCLPRDGKRELGYWIGREFWGKGIAKSSVSQFLAEYRERPLYARVATEHAASLRVLESCGFTVYAYQKSPADGRGAAVEEALLVLKGPEPANAT